MSTIQAVIFDWGGVLIDNPAPSIISYCRKALNVEQEIYTEKLKKYLPDFQRGRLSESAFWQQMCASLHTQLSSSSSLWGGAFECAYRPKLEMFRLAYDLKKAGYITGFLSNTEIPAVEFFKAQRYEQFDVVVFSCIENCVKPESEIYTTTLHRLGCNPDEAVFIDDNSEYVQAAADLGINAIQYTSSEAVFDSLKRLSIRW
jgi:epoxide hydrolase-like predicted phosphatase